MKSVWLVGLLVGCATAGDVKPDGPSTVMALGDSIAFGYNPAAAKDDPTAYLSYAQVYAEQRSAEVVNLACPGETSGSLAVRGAEDNGCRDWRSKHPLHFDYASEADGMDTSGLTQLQVAVHYLQDETKPMPDVITLDIGGNDLLLVSKQCPAGDSGCLLGKVPSILSTVLPQVQQHVETLFSSLRGAGYTGKIIVLTTYALDYSDNVSTFAIDDLNKVLRTAAATYDAEVADGYAAFQQAAAGGSACAAGLLYPLADGSCDIHPSVPMGATVLAGALAAAQ